MNTWVTRKYDYIHLALLKFMVKSGIKMYDFQFVITGFKPVTCFLKFRLPRIVGRYMLLSHGQSQFILMDFFQRAGTFIFPDFIFEKVNKVLLHLASNSGHFNVISIVAFYFLAIISNAHD